MSKFIKDNNELMREWDYEKNKGVDVNIITSGSSKKVWWKCEKGHEWEAVISSRSDGVGCPYCSGKKAIKGVNDFATLHSEMLNEWNYSRNEAIGIKPDEMLVGSQKKVWWKCDKGHEYERSIYDRLNGRSHCPYCSNRKVLKGFNDLATTNPELLKEWNYEKNDKLGIKPDEITNGGKNKVWWKCKKGHEWNSIIRSRITGSGCPYCSNNLVLKGYNDLATTNPEILNEWDYEKNKSITPFDISYGSDKKVWWKCSKGHEYIVSVAHKIKQNIKCPICANQQLLKDYNDFATKHPQLLKEWNYEKNDKLGIKPDEIVMGGKNKVWWKCERGHEWQSTINLRIRNDKLYKRCPFCSSYLRTSIPEKIIYYYLKQVFPNTVPNYKPKWLNSKELDIYIPELNVGIEYDGQYYHKNSKKDLEKDSLCSKNNVKLIRIREKGLKPIESSAIIYSMKKDNTGDYLYIEDSLEFLNNYLNINMDYDINRDIDKIISMINFLEKENCISKTNPEVLREWDYEKNDKLGINPDYFSNGSSLKVWWKCNKGHSYKATISTKINQDTKCPYCANKKILKGFNDLITTNPKLLKEWDFEENTKLGIKPEDVFKNSTKKIHWKCKNGHKWVTSLNMRNRGSNCPYCSGRYAIKDKTDLPTTNPEVMKEWDYEKNDKLGINPHEYKKNSDKKVWWKCNKGHSYESAIANRTRSEKTCCPYCANKKVLKGFNDLSTTNPELLKEWDYDENNKLGITPDNLTKGSQKKVWWKCSNNHLYQSTIPSRRRGQGCPYCSGNKIMIGFNDLSTTHPEILDKWDYEKNNKMGITPNSISKSYSKKVWWKCEKGHSYLREVYNQRKGSGKCPICRKEK